MKYKIIIGLLVLLLVGCSSATIETTNCIITDILQVSSGGLGASSRCIFETTCGKLNVVSDSICSRQIGEQINIRCVEGDCWHT